MENEIQKTGVVVFLESKNVSEETALTIGTSFEDFYNQAIEWEQKATSFLKDPNISQEEKAKESRTARLALVKVRTGIDKKRKELNDDDNKRIKERNNAAGVLTDLVTPIEEMLLAEEKAQEIAQKEANEKIKSAREAILKDFDVDTTFFDLINMPEESFQRLVETSKLAAEAKIQKEKEAEEKALLERRSFERKEQLYALGFKSHESGAFVHKLFDVHEEIEQYTNDNWDSFLAKLKVDILEDKRKEENAAQIKADELAKENARLAAEKEELERAEKAKETKHKAAIARQQILADIGVTLDYNSCAEMDEQTWIDFEKVKTSEYQAEQNRLFIEKKKQEFEEAQSKKAQAEKEAAERAAKLAPDKEKIKLAVDQCVMPKLELTSGATEAIYATILSRFEGFKKWANEQVTNLN